eukprot:g6889.t1
MERALAPPGTRELWLKSWLAKGSQPNKDKPPSLLQPTQVNNDLTGLFALYAQPLAPAAGPVAAPAGQKGNSDVPADRSGRTKPAREFVEISDEEEYGSAAVADTDSPIVQDDSDSAGVTAATSGGTRTLPFFLAGEDEEQDAAKVWGGGTHHDDDPFARKSSLDAFCVRGTGSGAGGGFSREKGAKSGGNQAGPKKKGPGGPPSLLMSLLSKESSKSGSKQNGRTGAGSSDAGRPEKKQRLSW